MNRRDFLKIAPLAIAARPGEAKADSPLWICGIIVIGIGVIVTIKLYKLCKNLFPPPPKPPPPPPQPCDCNMPGCTCPKANTQASAKINLKLTDDNINCFDVSNLGYLDPKTGAPIKLWFTAKLMRSLDCLYWISMVQIQGWYSQSGITLQFEVPGFPSPWTMATYLPLQGALELPIDLGDGIEQAAFFKLL